MSLAKASNLIDQFEKDLGPEPKMLKKMKIVQSVLESVSSLSVNNAKITHDRSEWRGDGCFCFNVVYTFEHLGDIRSRFLRKIQDTIIDKFERSKINMDYNNDDEKARIEIVVWVRECDFENES